MSNNPLKQYFRQPAIYLSLPSKGKFYPDGAIDMPPTGELPVYPMTAIDEITYRTPDALFNGDSSVSVIKSCIPNIRNPWAMPAMDFDSALIAIRIASYGHNMEIDTVCPKCEHDQAFDLDLRSILDKINTPDYTSTIKHGDLEINFKPLTYQNLNDNNMMQFEQQKLLQVLPNAEVPESEKLSAITNAMKQLTNITVRALAQGISVVKTPDSFVTEPEYIEEMLKNCDRQLFNQIRDHVISLKTQTEIKPITIKCTKCSHEYQQPITLDMTSFFADAS